MIIEEILLGDDADKKKKIEENLGKEVILKDEHFLWYHGVLVDEKENSEGSHDVSGGRYQLILFNQKRKLFDYSDLNQLLVLTHYSKL